MWVRIAARYALHHIPEVLARYRFTPDPEGARDLRHYRADLRVVEKNASLLPPQGTGGCLLRLGAQSENAPRL